MSDMKVSELERAVAQVEGACQLEAIRLVQQGTATRDEADAQYARWTRAIEKAERQLRMSCLDGGKKDKWWYSKPLDTYGFDSSSSLDQVYVSNDACSPCRAFENGNPWWHRAGFASSSTWTRSARRRSAWPSGNAGAPGLLPRSRLPRTSCSSGVPSTSDNVRSAVARASKQVLQEGEDVTCTAR